MKKREDYITWKEYFMKLAHLTSERSKDPNTRVGAVIVSPDNKIIGMGYNGLPNGCSDDDFSWDKPEKYNYVIHAEVNAIINSVNLSNVKNCVLYTTLAPCNECVKLLIQVGIKKIIYDSDKYHNEDKFIKAREMLDYVKIPYEQYSIKL